MSNLAKFVMALGAAALFGCASTQSAESEYAKRQLLSEYQAMMPVLAGWGDYGSASRVALAAAFERSRLEGATPEVCRALSQSRELEGMASSGRSREDLHVLAGIQNRTGSMSRERAACARAREVAAQGKAAGF